MQLDELVRDLAGMTCDETCNMALIMCNELNRRVMPENMASNIPAGTSLEVLVTLHPMPEVQVVLTDANGEKSKLFSRLFHAPRIQ